MNKRYKHTEVEPMTVKEPASAYMTADNVASLRNLAIRLVEETVQIDRLKQCIDILSSQDMPCTYTDEEFKTELELSEKSGFISNEEFRKSCLEKWGIEL